MYKCVCVCMYLLCLWSSMNAIHCTLLMLDSSVFNGKFGNLFSYSFFNPIIILLLLLCCFYLLLLLLLLKVYMYIYIYICIHVCICIYSPALPALGGISQWARGNATWGLRGRQGVYPTIFFSGGRPSCTCR